MYVCFFTKQDFHGRFVRSSDVSNGWFTNQGHCKSSSRFLPKFIFLRHFGSQSLTSFAPI